MAWSSAYSRSEEDWETANYGLIYCIYLYIFQRERISVLACILHYKCCVGILSAPLFKIAVWGE